MSRHWHSPQQRGGLNEPESPDVSNTRPYLYSSLQVSSEEIRLLTLLPGGFGTEIQCQLHQTKLDKNSPPQYEALSYAWGSAEDPVVIYVEKRTLPVSQNLAGALQHLRYSDRPRILWADAICVNQQDLEERSQQVPRMADIYTLAKSVVVWLGPEGDDSSWAMRTLDNIGSMVDADWTNITMRPSIGAVVAGELHWADQNATTPFKSGELVSVHYLLGRTWFERLWVRQEIQLATNAVFVCGFNTILWLRFRNAIFYLQAKVKDEHHIIDSRLGVFTQFWDCIMPIYYLCVPSHEPFSLDAQIIRTENCKCSDPRDRIYALLSISKIEEGVTIIVDYTRSTDAVYRDVVSQYFNSRLLLTYCEMQNPPSERPSWVPTWEMRRLTTGLPRFRAGGNSNHRGKIMAEANLMALIGIKVTNIKTTENISFPESLDWEVIDAIKRLTPPRLDVNADHALDIYCQTIFCNEFSDLYDPPQALHLGFQECLGVLRSLLETDERLPRTPSRHRFTNSASTYMRNRTFFWTEDGRMGLGPPSARPTDEVVVFPGCATPMILCQSNTGIRRYRVVGECFILDLMDGEAVLGPLPQGYQCVRKLDSTDGLYYHAYRNNRTGIVQDEDPRLSFLESDLREDGLRRFYPTGVPRNPGDRNYYVEIVAWTKRFPGEGRELRIMLHGNDLQGFLLE